MKTNRNLYLFTILTLFTIIAIIFFGSYVINKSDNTNRLDESPNSLIDDNEVEQNDLAIEWKTITFDKVYIEPSFKIKYPGNWREERCSASGCWDLNLYKEDKSLQFDLTGLSTNEQTNEAFDLSLDSKITNSGSDIVNYTFEIISEGNLPNINRKYITYKVAEENKSPYVIAIVDVAKMYNGRGHLYIKITDINDIDIIDSMLESITE